MGFKIKKEDIVKALPVVSPIASAAIAGGNSSGVGNLLSTSGNLVSLIPGGEIYGAGLNVAGGIFNGLLGSNIDEQAVQQYTDEASTLGSTSFASSNTGDLLTQANFGLLNNIKKSDIGSEGLFSNAVTNKANEINRLRQSANNQAQVNYGLAAESLDRNNDLIAVNNSFANGGPLIMRYAGTMSPFGNTFDEGGEIYIKPSKRGTFTAAAKKHGKSVQAFASQVLANKDNYSPAMVKKANFARNAAKWHAEGGPLHTQGGIWDNGLIYIGNGGTHEENPMEGVQMGMDAQGIPNLVEEGEVVFNDYVFSDRMKVPKAIRSKYKLKENKGITFADAAKRLAKESEERPNDPISKRGLDVMLSRLTLAQEQVRMEKQNKRKPKSKNLFAEGGPREMNPALYVHNEDTNNLVTPTGTKVIGVPVLPSNENYPTVTIPANTETRLNSTLSSSERPNSEGNGLDFRYFYDNYLQNTYGKNRTARPPKLTPAPDDNELLDVARVMAGEEPKGKMTPVLKPLISTDDSTKKTNNSSNLTQLRYAPVVGAAIGLGQNIFSKPDYSSSDAILNAANEVGRYTPVGFNTLGDYLTYRPFDRNYYINKLNAQSSATRRAIVDQSAGNGMAALAGLLAADYNAQGKLGDLSRQAEEYNLAQREKVATFNRGTNQFNAEMGLKAAMANLEAQQKARSARLSGITQAMTMRDAVDARRGASMSANLTNFFNSLGDIGREEFSRSMIMSNPALYYSIDSKGNISYKNGYENLSEAEKKEVRNAANKASKKKAKGGYLTIKKGGNG